MGNEKRHVYHSLARMSDDDYSGLLAFVGDGVRVVVNPAGTRYAVQSRAEFEGETVWVGSSYATLSAMIAKQGARFLGLADACDGLPERPTGLLPDLYDQHAEIVRRFAANDWRRDDYGRVIVRDGNLRLVVCTAGRFYRLQWICYADQQSDAPCNNWLSVKISSHIGAIKSHFYSRVGDPTDPDFYNPAAQTGIAHVAPRLQAAFETLPYLASDGQWPELPVRPDTVWID